MTEQTEKILNILKEEIVPAQGCTEPIAIAYAGAILTELLEGIPDHIDAYLSGNMIKNVKSVKIPGSEGLTGIEAAVAMGVLLGNAEKGMMVIAHADKTRLGEVEKYVRDGRIASKFEETDEKLYIRLEAARGNDNAVVEIQKYHTNVTRLEKNGVSFAKNCGTFTETAMTDDSFLTVDLIYETANNIDLSLVEPLFAKVIDYNSAIAEEGLKNQWGIGIGKTILESINEGVYGNDLKNNIMAFAAAGSDARMNGCAMPVMTTSGSGNQGMTCSLPIIKFCTMKKIPREKMIRGLLFSHLTTIHIKTLIGRLSAYCGAMAACAGVSGAMAYLDKLPLENIKIAISNTLGTVSGIICDGAKSSCACKIAVGLSSAFDSYIAAKKGRALLSGEGIIGSTAERTIANVGTLAAEGMLETDAVTVHIMMDEK